MLSTFSQRFFDLSTAMLYVIPRLSMNSIYCRWLPSCFIWSLINHSVIQVERSSCHHKKSWHKTSTECEHWNRDFSSGRRTKVLNCICLWYTKIFDTSRYSSWVFRANESSTKKAIANCYDFVASHKVKVELPLSILKAEIQLHKRVLYGSIYLDMNLCHYKSLIRLAFICFCVLIVALRLMGMLSKST